MRILPYRSPKSYSNVRGPTLSGASTSDAGLEVQSLHKESSGFRVASMNVPNRGSKRHARFRLRLVYLLNSLSDFHIHVPFS